VAASVPAKASLQGEPEPKVRRQPPASTEPASAPAARPPSKAKPATVAKPAKPATVAKAATLAKPGKPAAKARPDPAAEALPRRTDPLTGKARAGVKAPAEAATREKAPPGGTTGGRAPAGAAPGAEAAVAPAAPSAPAAGEARPEAASARPRRGLGSLGKQAFTRAAPALQLLPRPQRAAPPAADPGGLFGLVAPGRAAAAGQGGQHGQSGLTHDALALLRQELLALLALTEEPPETAPETAPDPR